MSTEQKEMPEISVLNFQIQYFPKEAKQKIEDMADRHRMSKRHLLILFAEHAEEIEEFLEKKKILPARA